MALAYPEGECFFIRSSLASSKSDGFHPDNAEEFYKTIIVEYVWNVEAYHASATVYKHPRSECKIVRGDWWNTDYGCWSQLPFSYGPSESDIRRRVQHNLCTNGNRFRDYEKGGSAEVSSIFPLRSCSGLTFLVLVYDDAHANQGREMALD